MVNKISALATSVLSSRKASVVTCLKAITGKDYSFYADCFIATFKKNVEHHGVVFSTKYMKSLYNYAVRMALEYPVKEIEPLPFRRITRHGIPRDLRPFRKLLVSRNLLDRRCALSILNLHEAIEGGQTFDLSTVTRTSELDKDFRTSLWLQFKDFRLKEALTPGTLFMQDVDGHDSMFISAKSGPNGKALECAHIDAFALRRVPELREAVIKLLTFDYERIGAKLPQRSPFAPLHKRRELPPTFKDTYSFVMYLFMIDGRFAPQTQLFTKGWQLPDPRRFEDFLHMRKSFSQEDKEFHVRMFLEANANYANKAKFKNEFSSRASIGVLRFLPAKSAKTRVVALVDYWSQLALRPIHKLFFDNLRKLGITDATFDHAQAAERLSNWVANRQRVWSYDLTAATDLFPAIVSRDLISAFYSEKLADLWYTVIVKRDFNLANRKGHTVRYGSGQPMGALSSWPVFALTHHAIVRSAAFRAGFSYEFSEYVIIGDDIVIADQRVASIYEEIMVDRLGCEISKGKSIISSKRVFRGEVAKRIFLRAHEITPLSPGACKEVVGKRLTSGALTHKVMVEKFRFLPVFLKMLHSRGWFNHQLRSATSAKGEYMAIVLDIAFQRRMTESNLRHRKSAASAYYRKAIALLSIPGVLPVSMLKHSDIGSTLREVYKLEQTRLRLEFLLFEFDLKKSRQRIDSTKESSAVKLKLFVDKYAEPNCFDLLPNRYGSELAEHPLLSVYYKEVIYYTKVVSDFKILNVYNKWLYGILVGIVLSPFDAQYVSDFYKLVGTADVLLCMTLLNVSKISRYKRPRYYDTAKADHIAGVMSPSPPIIRTMSWDERDRLTSVRRYFYYCDAPQLRLLHLLDPVKTDP